MCIKSIISIVITNFFDRFSYHLLHIYIRIGRDFSHY